MKKISLIMAIAVLLTSCSTLVRIETPGIEGATIKINDQPVGKTPVKQSLSDAIWEEYDVEVSKEGYKTYYGRLRKEVKVGALVGGIIVWPFLLWVYGPEPFQTIYLEPLEKDI
ncbi:MAG: PEGA domain-containing protein [FCB group bacterium]|nr:PEGA domain-containing protein [FCB group bacterium]